MMALVEMLVVLAVVDGSAKISSRAEKMKADTARSMWGDVFIVKSNTLEIYLRDRRTLTLIAKGDIDKGSFCYYHVDGCFAISFLAKNGDKADKFEIVFSGNAAKLLTGDDELSLPNNSSIDNGKFSAVLMQTQ